MPDANPVGREVTCEPGVVDSTTTRGSASATIRYEYQWQRNGDDIAGEIANTYTTTVGDLGTDLSCLVWSSNPAGRSDPQSSGNRRIPLPAVTSAGTMYTAIGKNEYVPINMMAIGREYKRVVDEYALRKLSDGEERRGRALPQRDDRRPDRRRRRGSSTRSRSASR